MPLSVGAVNKGNISVGPLESATVPLTLALSDTLTLTDSLLAGYGALHAVSLTLSDAIFIAGQPLVTSDTLVLSDTIQYTLDLPISFNEAFNFIDSLSSSVGFTIGLADPLSFTDSISTALGTAIQLSESVSLSDTFTAALGVTLFLTKAENLTLTEAYLFNLIGKASTLIPPSPAGNPEVIVFTDSFSHRLSIVATFGDSLTIGDTLDVTIPLSNVFSDSAVFSDNLGIGIGASLSEVISFSDVYSANDNPPLLALTLVIGEMLNLSDPFNQQNGQVSLQLTEQIHFGDSINQATDLGLTSYLRRYLNDVTMGVN